MIHDTGLFRQIERSVIQAFQAYDLGCGSFPRADLPRQRKILIHHDQHRERNAFLGMYWHAKKMISMRNIVLFASQTFLSGASRSDPESR
jgi:hypothetical protein